MDPEMRYQLVKTIQAEAFKEASRQRLARAHRASSAPRPERPLTLAIRRAFGVKVTA